MIKSTIYLFFIAAACAQFLHAYAQHSDTLNPVADVYVKTYGGGEGKNTFIKFDISSIPANSVVSDVTLQVYVTVKAIGWDGDMKFMNVNNQAWMEGVMESTLWGYLRTDTILQALNFGNTTGWTSSVNLKQILLRDYNASNTFCSVMLKDIDDPTIAPGGGNPAYDSNDSLMAGNMFNDYIIFAPREFPLSDSIPRLIVSYIISPEITTHPLDQEVCNGDTVTFTVAASGDAPLAYQWQKDGVDIPGANSDLFSINPASIVSAGNYRCVVTNAVGSDTSNVAVLTVNPVFLVNQSAAICFGDSILLGGAYQTSSGTYYDSLTTMNGCDSVIVTTLDINPVYLYNETSSICNGDVYTWHGNNYSSAGIFYDSLTTTSGCDSIYKLTLTVSPTYSENKSAVICSGDSILIGGSYQTAAGTYYDTLAAITGCDSVLITSLSVTTLTITTSSVDASCNGYCNGVASASGAGGTPPYSYLWEDGNTTTTINGLCTSIYSITVADSNACTAIDSVSVGQPALLTVSVTATNTSCYGICDGQLTANPSGGTAPYSYLWDNSATTSAITGLCVETRYVTVTDNNGCTAWEYGSVAEPAVLNLSTTFTEISCYGLCDATATASATGGTPPYSYLWTGGIIGSTATGLCPGLVEVTVTDANGCIAPGSLFFNEPSPLAYSVVGSDAVCAGVCNGEAYPNAYDGTPPYTYSWNTGTTDEIATGLCPGTYTVTITDANGCTIDTTITVSVQYTFSATLYSNNITCNGLCDGTADAVPDNGIWPFTYLWSTNETTLSINGLCSGIFTVTVSDVNGCSVGLSANISEPPAITTTVASVNPICAFMCDGMLTVSVSGGAPGYSYYWDTGSIDTMTNGLCAGTFYVTVTDLNGCTAVNSGDITEPLPLDGYVTMINASCASVCDGSAEATIYGGTPPYTYQWSNGSSVSSISSLCAGYYQLDVWDSAGCGFNTGFDIFDMNNLWVNTDNIVPVTACLVADGEIYISVSGGSGNYSYLWQPGGFTTEDISGLSAGTYSVTATDTNSCYATASVTVPSASTVTVTVDSVENIYCTGGANGAVFTSVTGGTPPYSYLWSNGGNQSSVNGLATGSYTVTVTDNDGCSEVATAVISEPGIWTQKANFIGNPTFAAVGFSIGNKGYVGTGFANPNSFWEYDPVTDSWSQMANFTGIGRYGSVGFGIGTKGYIGTGTDGGSPFSDFYEYDPALNSWSQVSDLPASQRYAAVGFSIGNKGYVGMGYEDGGYPFMDFWEYDAGGDIWTPRAGFPGIERFGAVGIAIGTKGYVGTGYDNNSFFNDFYEYDPVMDSWVQKAQFPGDERYGAAGFALNAKGYLGTGTGSSSYSDFWEYDPATDSWAQRADFSGGAREGAVAFSIGNSGYLGTGTTGFMTMYNDWWEFNMGTQSPQIDSVNTIPATCNNCPDGSATVYANNGSPPYTYLWSNGATASAISNQLPDTLTVTITDSLGCEVTGTVIIDFIVSGNDLIGDGLHFTVYPNPNNGRFALSTNNESFANQRINELQIRNILGQSVWEMACTNSFIRTNSFFVDLQDGVYSLILKSNDSVVGVQRIVVVK